MSTAKSHQCGDPRYCVVGTWPTDFGNSVWFPSTKSLKEPAEKEGRVGNVLSIKSTTKIISKCH